MTTPDGGTVVLSKPTADEGPWEEHERRAAISLRVGDHEELLPPEAFDDDGPEAGDAERLVGEHAKDPDARNSVTVLVRMRSSCAGYAERPDPHELYDAVRADDPTARQKTLLRMWVTETEWFELIQAWAEGVYTLRQLVGALHRSGISESRHSRTLNRWAARLESAEWTQARR